LAVVVACDHGNSALAAAAGCATHKLREIY
jgi:hypothetical protein